ncbi:MAG: crossover junction endodeoxyribonuclease RuvC [Candidatus Pacebacteria bacterium]|nr:crossover junction endodeoxyribonuclease RuvC [Candidatus Paceibacterota bacterium]
MIIIGIDPGTSRIGYGIIKSESNKLSLLDYGTIEPKSKEIKFKFLEINDSLEALIKLWQPKKAGIERIFFTKNQKTGISVAEARGVIMHCLLKNGINTKEYRPQDIKQAVTGYGAADKISVAKMVKTILKIGDLKGYDDSWDALAISLTRAFDKDLESLSR